jgi:hypothetical protein
MPLHDKIIVARFGIVKEVFDKTTASDPNNDMLDPDTQSSD